MNPRACQVRGRRAKLGLSLLMCPGFTLAADASERGRYGGAEGPSQGSTELFLSGHLFAVYNMESQVPIVPFVRAGGGVVRYTNGETKTSMVFPSIGIGVRALVADSGSINFVTSYEHHNDWAGIEGLDVGQISFGVGVSIFHNR